MGSKTIPCSPAFPPVLTSDTLLEIERVRSPALPSRLSAWGANREQYSQQREGSPYGIRKGCVKWLEKCCVCLPYLLPRPPPLPPRLCPTYTEVAMGTSRPCLHGSGMLFPWTHHRPPTRSMRCARSSIG